MTDSLSSIIDGLLHWLRLIANSPVKVLSIFLVCALIARASTLEINALADPTETRYASIAQEMILGGDWVTPKLPMPTGIEPYLGKPPLHFWMTAASYSAFGVDEWSSRFPSFVAMLAIVALLLVFSRKFLTLEIGMGGAGILLSCAIFFFFSGASVIDVTLTACVTLAIVGFALGMNETGRTRLFFGAMVSLGAALGFLTKGPIAIALIAGTALGFSLLRRDFGALRRYPWVAGIALFLVATAPWFIWSEIRNPGFLKYFVWNENIARYLFKEYGDLYGRGHRHPRGFVWLALFLALLPWTPLLLHQSWRQRRALLSEPRALLLAWGLSVAVFFTFVRQLHIGYVIPGLPALSLLLADLVHSSNSHKDTKVFGSRYLNWLSVIACVVSAGSLLWILYTIGIRPRWETLTPVLILCLCALGAYSIWHVTVRTANGSLSILHGATVSWALMYGILLIAVTPQLDRSTSTENMLDKMSVEIREDNPQIGVFANNTYSYYWLANAGTEELDRPVRITYFDSFDVGTIRHLLVRQKDISGLPEDVAEHYRQKAQIGKWVWLRKRKFPDFRLDAYLQKTCTQLQAPYLLSPIQTSMFVPHDCLPESMRPNFTAGSLQCNSKQG